MRRFRCPALLIVCSFAIISGCAVSAPDSRNFSIRYVAHVQEIPAGTQTLRLWLPVPQANDQQTIGDLKFRGPYKPRLTFEPVYGNKFAYYEIKAPSKPFNVEFTFSVKRFEDHGSRTATKNMMKMSLKENRMIPISESVNKQATKIVKDRTSIRDRGRALYDHVLKEMTYDKSGTGWGRGDFRHACDVGRGNCTDFHAYFIGLCRNIGIPARFEIGLSVPDKPGKTGGYHCWAYFRDGSMWVPVDISEADKHPEKAEYFFGTHCRNRVTFTRGRDLVLKPAQAASPLNFMIYPYAEADGKPLKVTKTSYLK